MQTDHIMKNSLMCMCRDFAPHIGEPTAKKRITLLRENRIAELRALEYPIWDTAPVYFNKCMQQIGSFMKRYRLEHDVFSDEELRSAAWVKFKQTQVRVSRPFNTSLQTYLWLQEARRVCAKILGAYSKEDHFALSRFGKRACKGHPLAKAYLDLKLNGPYTGSLQHIAWFKEYLASDKVLSDVIDAAKADPDNSQGIFTVCDRLDLSFVPKSWKAMRSIKPNTLLGSFYTYGLGKLIQDKLTSVGLDITRLQDRHKRIVSNWGFSRYLVTADLSSASDSISRELLQKVLPRSWYRAVMFGFIGQAHYAGEQVLLSSVCAMGDGHTFPLQTLVFYSLLKAIGNLLGKKSYVSVYGDDLIYNRHMHKYVRVLFPAVHLIINEEKTYVHSYFRESCGTDTFRGVDIRPASLEGRSQVLQGKTLCAFLYKLHNCLTRHWERCEIPQTLEYLENLIYLNSRDGILQVPPSYPDYSGVKVDKPNTGYGYSAVRWNVSKQMLSFRYLGLVPKRRVVQWVFPYYWDTLRARSNNEAPDIYSDFTDVLAWRKTVFIRHGRKVASYEATTPQRSTERVRGQTGSANSWI